MEVSKVEKDKSLFFIIIIIFRLSSYEIVKDGHEVG